MFRIVTPLPVALKPENQPSSIIRVPRKASSIGIWAETVEATLAKIGL